MGGLWRRGGPASAAEGEGGGVQGRLREDSREVRPEDIGETELGTAVYARGQERSSKVRPRAWAGQPA